MHLKNLTNLARFEQQNYCCVIIKKGGSRKTLNRVGKNHLNLNYEKFRIKSDGIASWWY